MVKTLCVLQLITIARGTTRKIELPAIGRDRTSASCCQLLSNLIKQLYTFPAMQFDIQAYMTQKYITIYNNTNALQCQRIFAVKLHIALVAIFE
jgi:hypothetical protein